MNLAKNYALNYNPIDTVEDIFASKSYELERRNTHEVAVEVQGKWNNMLLFFSWEENMRCLHLSCLMDIRSTIEDRTKIFELMALAYEELWIGLFSYWTDQNIDDSDRDFFESKIAQIIDIAIKECERMYPIFHVVLTKGMNPQLALYPMMMETAGQA